jgi:hypothetical protein
MEKEPSDKLQPEFTLPSGPRLKRMALIGLALAAKKSTVRKKITAGRMSFPTEVKCCSWEGDPAFWTPSEAWALLKGSWVEVNAADVGRNSSDLTTDEFGKMFGKLPHLPKSAFQSREAAIEDTPKPPGRSATMGAQASTSGTPDTKLAQAQADQDKWSRVAADPSLSPRAAAWAKGAAISAAAEVTLRQKALQHLDLENKNRFPPVVQPQSSTPETANWKLATTAATEDSSFERLLLLLASIWLGLMAIGNFACVAGAFVTEPTIWQAIAGLWKVYSPYNLVTWPIEIFFGIPAFAALSWRKRLKRNRFFDTLDSLMGKEPPSKAIYDPEEVENQIMLDMLAKRRKRRQAQPEPPAK